MSFTENPQNGAVMVAIAKGGFGKTTISLNLADRLGRNYGKTLYVDCDHNGHGTAFTGYEEEYQTGKGIYDVIAEDANPEDVVIETKWDFDILPATPDLGKLSQELNSYQFSHTQLKNQVVDPLLEGEYDHVVIDSPGERNKVMDNALIATRSVIIPVMPGAGGLSGVKRILQDQILPVRNEGVKVDILAITPNNLTDRIDQDRADRRLLERLNENFPEYVPEYARITDEDWKAIDNGTYDGELPGIRKRDAISDSFDKANQPLAHFAPSNDQLKHFDYLASLVAERA